MLRGVPQRLLSSRKGFRRERRRAKAPKRSEGNVKNDWAQVVVKFMTELKCIVLGVFCDLFSPALLPLGVTVPYNMIGPPYPTQTLPVTGPPSLHYAPILNAVSPHKISRSVHRLPPPAPTPSQPMVRFLAGRDGS